MTTISRDDNNKVVFARYEEMLYILNLFLIGNTCWFVPYFSDIGF